MVIDYTRGTVSARTRARTKRRRQRHWANLPDDELLDLRLCDLHDELSVERSQLAPRVQRLYDELERRGLRFRPHVWISSEWFSPDGVPGIAIPFFLAHPRLMRLEQKMMLKIEGGTAETCMKLLRHETGHAIDNAYRLHYRKRWRELFGSFAEKYPETYQPKPYSRHHVLHLDNWYAQAHPAEDFAETFAVWLRPRSGWRKQYKGWPALRKLQYVHELMQEIADEPAPVRSRKHVESLKDLKQTLRAYYHEKRMIYGVEWPDFFDDDLQKLFSDDERYADRPSAAQFMRSIRADVRRLVSKWTGEHPYTIDQVLRDMIDRCRELKMRLAIPQRQARTEAVIMVAVQTMNYLHNSRHRIAV